MIDREQLIEAMLKIIDGQCDYRTNTDYLRDGLREAFSLLETTIPGLADVIADKAVIMPVDLTEKIRTEIYSVLRGRSSPTVGRGAIHGGQSGIIIYEPELSHLPALIIAALIKVAAASPVGHERRE